MRASRRGAFFGVEPGQAELVISRLNAALRCAGLPEEQAVTAPDASALSESPSTLGQLSVPPTLDLKPHDFRELWREKKSAHLQGTREWAFAEILEWLDDPESPQLFWLMGGGGTGKSVLTAELLDRVIHRAVAWHFCRHDNPAQSAPGSLLRSLAAMLAHRLPGYKEKLEATGVPGEAVDDPAELFKALFETPLLVSKVQAPERPLLVILDALDELPKESQKPLLGVIASQLSRLPSWLKLFVTSREEPQISRALSSFKPKELRADEAKNRADVEVYLRTIARSYIKGEATIADIEADVKRTYGIDMKGKLAILQKPMEMSKAIYAKVREKVSAEDGYKKLIAVPEKRNADLVQVSDDLHIVHGKQAPEAQKRLEFLIADKWEADPKKETLLHPVPGTARAWVEFADSPGIKSEPRVSEKMKTTTVAMPTSSRTSRGSPCASPAARAWHTRLPRGSRGRASKCSRSRISTRRRRRWATPTSTRVPASCFQMARGTCARSSSTT
jgi:hypothetical protein